MPAFARFPGSHISAVVLVCISSCCLLSPMHTMSPWHNGWWHRPCASRKSVCGFSVCSPGFLPYLGLWPPRRSLPGATRVGRQLFMGHAFLLLYTSLMRQCDWQEQMSLNSGFFPACRTSLRVCAQLRPCGSSRGRCAGSSQRTKASFSEPEMSCFRLLNDRSLGFCCHSFQHMLKAGMRGSRRRTVLAAIGERRR